MSKPTLDAGAKFHDQVEVFDDLPPMEEADFFIDPTELEEPNLDDRAFVVQDVPAESKNLVINEVKQGRNKQGDYVFGTDEIRKDINTKVVSGDKAYVAAEHGTVLLQEKGPKDRALEAHDYYDTGYTAQQKNNFGDESNKQYHMDREADMLGRKLAEDYVHEKTKEIVRGPRKKIEKKKIKNKAKIIESYGCASHPERQATEAEKEPVNLTCVHCHARMTTKVEKKIDPMKFMVMCLPVVTLFMIPSCPWAYDHIHTCTECGGIVGGTEIY